MPDFSYLDSSGVGQIQTPFQQPNTLKTDTPFNGPTGDQPVDFSQLWKSGQNPTIQQNPTGLIPIQRDSTAYKGPIAPRTFNADRMVPYEKSDAFQKLGFNPDMPENRRQAQYDYGQSNWEAVKSSLSDLGHVTGQAFVNYFKSYGDTIKSLTDNGTMYDSDITQVEQDAQRARSNLRFKGDVPTHWYNYIPLPGLMKGDVAEELLPQLGFTIGTGAAAMLENLAVTVATAGEGEIAEIPNSLSKVYKLISEFSTLKRGAALAKGLYNGPVSNIRAGLDAWRLVNATLSETSLEGASNYIQHRDKVVQDYIDKNGHAPDEKEMQKIKDSADNVASETMWGEFPVLMASNWIQYRNLMAPTLAKKLAQTEALQGMSVVNRAADKIGSEFAVQEPHVASGIKGFLHGAGHFAKNATTEGLEETGQRFVSTSASNYEEDIYKGKEGSALHSMFSVGLPDILSDSGLQEFMGGFVTGGLFHSLGSVGNKLATLKPEVDENGVITGYKKNFLQTLGFGTEQLAKAGVRSSLQTLAASLNSEDLKSIFKEEGLVNMLKSAQDSFAMNQALRNNDIFNAANLKSNALIRFLYTGLETGKLDLRLAQLDAFKGQSQEQLNQFFGMDTGINKDSVDAMIDHVSDTAQRVSQIYENEKDRFADKQQKAYKAYKDRVDSHERLEQNIRTKYNIAPDGDMSKELASIYEARKTAGEDIADMNDDIVNYHKSRLSTNEAVINLIAVKEGRKAAVFAAANMSVDSKRSQGYIDTMASVHPVYSQLKELLNDKDLETKYKEIETQMQTAKGVDNKQYFASKRQLESLSRLRGTLSDFMTDQTFKYLQMPGRKEVASALYDYMNNQSDDKDSMDRRANRLKEEIALGMVAALEKRNRDNLALYNRLTTSDKDFKEYSEHETQKTADTITKWVKEFLDKKAQGETITPNQAQANPVQAPQVIPQPNAQTTPQQVTPTTQQNVDRVYSNRFSEIKQKVAQGQELDEKDRNFLTVGAATGDKDVADFYKQYLDNQAKTAAPEAPVVVDAAVVYRSIDAHTVPNSFIPEDDTRDKEDETVEKQIIVDHLSPVVKDPNRTIVNEIPLNQMNAETPKLYGGYTAWKQRFFDTVAQNDMLDRYTGVIVLDSKENYPADSPQYKYLEDNPDRAGIVLKIVDKNGNDRVDDNFLPDNKGNRIIHSMPNSLDKQALFDTMAAKNITEVPVDFNRISQGIFDELSVPRKTALLLDGISTADYQFIIAEGPVGEKFFYANGTLLRNGGLYIQTKGSFIKLLPELSANLKVNDISNPDVYSLIGKEFSSFEQAKEVTNFLETLFYTDRLKGGLEFNVLRAGSKYTVMAQITQNKQAIPLSNQEVTGALKARRINVDKSKIGSAFRFYHVVNGQVQFVSTLYNQFLKDNTLTNKKAYETAEGRKVLKPVNRYLTFNKTLKSISDELNPLAIHVAGNTLADLTGIPEENESLTQEPTKPKRRRFDTEGDTTFDDIDKLLSRKNGDGGEALASQAEVKWLQQRFGKQAVVQLKNIIDADAWGTWTKAGITLYADAPSGTGYHEAWHHFSQLFLTIPQKQALYNEVRSRVDSLKGKSSLDVEEHIAEDFRKYVQSDGQLVLGERPERNGIFRRIWDFIKRFFGGKTNRLEGLYRDLYEGNLRKYSPSHSNSMFGTLNSKIVDKSGNEILNNQKSYRYIRYMDSLFGSILSDAGVTSSQLYTGDSEITRTRLIQTYREMYRRLKEKYNELADRLDDLEAKHPDQAFPIADTLDDLEKLITNFGSVASQHRKFSTLQLEKISDDDAQSIEEALNDETPSLEQEEADEADNAGHGWDKAGNEFSVIETSTPETKSLIRGLSRVATDKEGNPIIKGGKVQLYENEFGLTEPINFTQVFNNLGILLEGSKDYQEMLTKMSNRDNQIRYPELALILERLPKLDSTLKYTDVSQLVRFYQDFAKTYIPIYTLVRKLDGGYFFREETKRTRELIKREWSNNFFNITRDSPLVKNNTILFDESARPYINPTAILDYNLQNPEDRLKFLNFLGVQLSPLTLKSAEYKKITAADLGYILQNVRNRLKAGQRITNPVVDLGRQYQNIYSENKVLNSLLELESKYSSSNPSMSYKTAEGNMQHGLSLNNWTTANNYWLSRTLNYSQIVNDPSAQHLNVNNNPYIANSLFLNKLFNMDSTSTEYGTRRRINGEPVTIILGNYNGFKREIAENKNEGASTTSLGVRDKIIMDVNSLMVGGAVSLMRTESSASDFFMRLSDYSVTEGQEDNLPVSPYEMEGDVRHPKVIDYFLGAFKDELASIANKFNSTLPGYNSFAGKFTMFDSIIGPRTKEAIMSRLEGTRDNKKLTAEQKQAVIDKVYSEYAEVAGKQIGTFLDEQVKEFNELLRKEGIGFSDISITLTNQSGNKRALSMPEITNAFIVNNIILNSEFSRLFAGNLGFYKAYHKRSKGDTSTGIIPAGDPFIKSYLEQTKAKTLASALGADIAVNLRETKTIVYKDDMRQSVYTTGRNSSYKQAIAALNPEMTKDQIDKLLDKSYGNMTVADGQGHATLDFYREMRIRVKNWSYVDEVQYIKEVIGTKRSDNLYTDEAERQRDDKFMDDYKNVNSTFPPMKMQYNGPLKAAGVFAPVLDKFSIVPLIPSVVKGTNWEATNKELLKAGIGYTKFESGTKKYKFTPAEFYSSHEGFTASMADIDVSNPATHFAEGLKEQIVTNGKIKKESPWGTQMRKLFLANLFNSGIAADKFTKILDNYIDILNKVQDEQKASLYKEFGITEHGDDIKITDVKNFVKTLQRQVDSNNLNDNIKDFIRYDKETKSFAYPLEVSLNKAQVQDLISGMIFKKLTRLKINGDMLIQVASSGFEPVGFKYTNAIKADIEKYGTNGLPFYKPVMKDGKVVGTEAMRVKVALVGEWTKLLKAKDNEGNEIGTIERLNELLKDDKWREANRKKISMIGYRIPTQGPNSMEFMEVHEFLPAVAGSIVILPAEIVAKAGSDYDIDKMNIFRPSLDSHGELISEETANAMEERASALEAKYQDLLGLDSFSLSEDANGPEDVIMNRMLFPQADSITGEMQNTREEGNKLLDIIEEYDDIKDARTKLLTNRVMDLYREVLSSPEMFTQLVTPNNVLQIKPVAEQLAKMQDMFIGDFKNTDVIKPTSNWTKFVQLLSGKRDIGIFARANTMSQLLQQAGMNLNAEYRLFETIKGVVAKFDRTNTQLLLTPEERKGVTKTVVGPNGSSKQMIDYSSNVDVNGVYKQEYFSELMNATVDIAADPYYMAFGLNDQTIGAAVHMVHQGIPFERAMMFINQPIVKAYVSSLKKEGNIAKWSIIGQLLGMDPRKSRKAAVLNKIEAIDNSKTESGFYFNIEELKRNIEKPSSSSEWYERKVLAHFLKNQEQGGMLRDLQNVTSFDTTKFLTPVSAQNNLDMRQQITASGLFDEQGFNRILNHSMISPFNSVSKNIDVFSRLMPVGMNRQVIEASAEIMRGFRGSKKDRLRLERTLSNDWIEFILKNYAQIGEENFEDYAKKLLVQLGDNYPLATELIELKNRFPALKYYDTFRRLYPSFTDQLPTMKNIELYRGIDSGSDYQNVIIEELSQLINFKGNEIPGARFTEDEAHQVRSFFRRLGYFAFQQSGFNKGPLFFTDVIPHEELSGIFKAAIQRFENVIASHPIAMEQIIKEFTQKFKEQNPNFVINDDKQPSKQYWRGKFYKVGGNESETNYTQPDSPDDYVPPTDNFDDIMNRTQEPSMPMQDDNIQKIKSGQKTITNRTYKVADGVYSLPDGTKVEVSYKGIAKVQGDKVVMDNNTELSKDSFARMEGFKDWADFEQNTKYSKNFINGSQERYIYSINPIGPSDKDVDDQINNCN